MSGSNQWGDLVVRLVSGAIMAVLGLGAIWAGGYVFIWFVAIATGIIVWELTRMLSGDMNRSLMMGLVSGTAAILAVYVKAGFALPILSVPLLVGFVLLKDHWKIYVPYLAFILLAGFGMMSVRSEYGFVWMGWLVLVVAATDIAGYFAGRLIGGPKFWPSISPKKTWAGTSAGWVASAIVGWAFIGPTGAGAWLILLSICASFASQLGDIAESAVKRRSGVKDSSALIPGHGGLFDRFDGMLAASVLVLVVVKLTGFSTGTM